MSEPAERLWQALDVPPAALVERRVAKSMLIEQAGLTAVDKKFVETDVERLEWRATLKPTTVGLAAFAEETRDYTNVVVMKADLRTAMHRDRMTQILHRAVTAPLILITGVEEFATFSIGLKRRHERDEGRVVVERLVVGEPVADGSSLGDDDFLASLEISRLPATDLWGLHLALSERIEAHAAVRACKVWRLPADEPEAAARREALARLTAERREVARLRQAAIKERKLARRVALAGDVQRAEAALARTIDALR